MNALALFAALDTLVLEGTYERKFRCAGVPPSWCVRYWPECRHGVEDLAPEDRFPFLEVFLGEAEKAWSERPPRRVESETWTQFDNDGAELHLQATAMMIDDARLLLLSKCDDLHRARQLLLSRARELAIARDAAAAEAEQKDVLVHCIIHDLQVPLSTILSATTELQETAGGSSSAWRLAGVALEAAQRQRALILDVLQVFAPEPTGTSASDAPVADLVAVVDRSVELFREVAEKRHLQLLWNRKTVQDPVLPVVGDGVRLERVVAKLVDSCIRNAVSLVTVSIANEGEVACVAVDDDGPVVPEELAPQLFARLSDVRGGSGLGLYFSRITVERWGGSVGHEPRPGGGMRLWLRLPRAPTRDGSAVRAAGAR